MRTQRRPLCSNVAPARSARSSSASEIDAGPSSSATTSFHATTASRPKRFGWSAPSCGVARPLTRTPARTRRSGPTSSMPRAASSAGACSRNRSASSTDSSSPTGSCSRARSAATSTHSATVVASVLTSAPQPVQVVGTAGDLDRHGRRLPHVLRRAPATGVDLVDELEADVPVVVGVVGNDEAHARQHDGLAAQAPLVALEAGRQRRQLVGVGDAAAADQRIDPAQRPHDGAGSHHRRIAAARQRRLPVPLGEAVPGQRVDHRGMDVDDRRRVVRRRDADRRHRRGELRRARRRRPGRRRAPTGRPACRGRCGSAARRARPRPSPGRGRRRPRASAASPSCTATGATRSQRAARSAGQPHRRGRIASPSSRTTSSDDRWPTRNGLAVEPHRGSANARCSVLGSAVWTPSHPHRCTVPPTQDADDRRRRAVVRTDGRVACGGHRGRRLGTRPTLPRGCHAEPEPPLSAGGEDLGPVRRAVGRVGQADADLGDAARSGCWRGDRGCSSSRSSRTRASG